MAHIQLYHIPSTLNEITFERASSLINSEEKDSAARMRAERRLHEFVLGRYLLKTLLAEKINVKPEAITLKRHEHGKLYLEDNPVFFNLTHSGEYIAIGLCEDYEIGIDIEHITRRNTDISGIAKRYFTQEESLKIESAPHDQQAPLFYEAWTKKEAVLKATGIGIGGGLNSFDAFESHKNSPTFLITEKSTRKVWLQYWPLTSIYGEHSLYFSAAVCDADVQPTFELEIHFPNDL